MVIGRVVPILGLGGCASTLATAGCVDLLEDADAVGATLTALGGRLVVLLDVVREILIVKT